MSRPVPDPDPPFFITDINKEFIRNIDEEKVPAIKEYQLLTLDEFLEKLDKTTEDEENKKIENRTKMSKFLSEYLCRNKINSDYGIEIVEYAIKYNDYDLIILAKKDGDRSSKPSDPKRPKDDSDPDPVIRILESVVGFLIVQKGECKTYPRDYSVNLICVRDGHDILQGAAQVLLGLYLYTILERQNTTGYLQRGLLELAGGYTNIKGLCLYSKFGFLPSMNLAIPDCFPYAENMPMELVFQTKYVLDDVRSDSDNEGGYTTPPQPATPDAFTTPTSDHASDNPTHEIMNPDEIVNAKQIVCSIVTGDHEGFKLPICNIRENQHALIALSEYIRLHEYLITGRIDPNTFGNQCSRTNELKLIYSMFRNPLKVQIHEFINNLITRMESIDHETLDPHEKEFIKIILSVGSSPEDMQKAVDAYNVFSDRWLEDPALQNDSAARAQKPGGGRNKKTAKRGKRNKKTIKRNKKAAKRSKRKN
jgi:hypothetical protein